MKSIWFFSPHILRGILGLCIMKSLPMTHDIIKNACIPTHERLTIDKIFLYLNTSAKEALDHFQTKTKRLLSIYIILTVICFGIDFVYFLISVKHFATGISP
jgi:hypothetical protein